MVKVKNMLALKNFIDNLTLIDQENNVFINIDMQVFARVG